MFLVVKTTDHFPSDLIDAIDADRFHLSLDSAKRMATGLRSLTKGHYEVIELSSVWDTNQWFNASKNPEKIDTREKHD